MRRILSAALMALALAGPAKANEDIEAVIAAQIEAFLADDFTTAFSFASPMIKGIFGTPERFGQMVREGYPMVWRPAEVEFLEAERRGRTLWQNVLIRDGDGVFYELEYQMVPGADGWKINAVRVKKAAEGMV